MVNISNNNSITIQSQKKKKKKKLIRAIITGRKIVNFTELPRVIKMLALKF